MSKALNISVSNVELYNTDGVSAISYDCHVGNACRHKVVVRTTTKFKQQMKAKIKAYYQKRQK